MQTPIYDALDCPLCQQRQRGVCADCGRKVPTEADSYTYKNMGGCGFQSHTADHRHAKIVHGVQGFGQVKRELCAECYRIDWPKAYPLEECPV